MKPEMKKLIIANLPYLLFVYLFGKLGQTYRLAAGADLSEKLLHLADGFSLAFESAAPSFHLFDLAVGVAGAVALRLMVYCKSKNAKKYRRGVEYGSARWGGPKDITPYIDPVFDNNILLTQTERLTMNNRPKDPPEQKCAGDRRFRQRQDEIFCETQPHAVRVQGLPDLIRDY